MQGTARQRSIVTIEYLASQWLSSALEKLTVEQINMQHGVNGLGFKSFFLKIVHRVTI